MSTEQTKPRILAVDDSRVMRVAMRKILGKDYEVIEAEHGEDAWTLLTNDDSIQVLFTDLSMPYLDGYGLLARMRESDDTHLQEMPVIIITGKEDDDNAKQQALDNGASDFISKPFESVQLLARAKAHVKFKETSSKLSETSEKLERQSTVDEVTGLGGQRYFCKAAEEALSYMKRNGGQYIVFRMDIDNFNNLFIKHGKQVADGVLKTIGPHLVKLVRQEDMLARIGLAKFAMLLRNTTMENAEQIADRMRQTVQGLSFKIGDEKLSVTVSIGLLEPDPKADNDIKAVIEKTEQYLNQAIKAGGNQIAKHSVTETTHADAMAIETALIHLEKGQTDNVRPHLAGLLLRLIPLLELAGRQFSDEFSKAVETLKQQIKK